MMGGASVMCSCGATVKTLAFTLSWEATGTILVAVLTASRPRGPWQKQGDQLGGCYHGVDRMRVVWASMLAVEVGRYDWRYFKGTVDRIY